MTASEMKSRDSFSRYIYKLHERINKNLKKTSNLTYNDVRERYEHFRSRCAPDEVKPNNKVNSKNKLKSKTSSTNKTKKRNKKKEKGCTESLYGKKAKCIIQIVPKDKKCKTFQMDQTCKKRIKN
jgi:hypothetical protein